MADSRGGSGLGSIVPLAAAGPQPAAIGRIAVIIPARDEEASLGAVLDGVREHLPGAVVIVVDDDSRDATAAVAARHPGVTVLRPPCGLGVGGAVQLGIRYGLERGCATFVRLDGDGQHPAACLPGLVGRAGPGRLVLGSRSGADFAGTSTGLRRLGSLWFRALFKVGYGRDVPDPTSGLACFGRDLAERFARAYPTDFPELETLALLLRAGIEVVPVPVAMRPRLAGRSSLGWWRGPAYALTATLAILISRLRRNPYRDPE